MYACGAPGMMISVNSVGRNAWGVGGGGRGEISQLPQTVNRSPVRKEREPSRRHFRGKLQDTGAPMAPPLDKTTRLKVGDTVSVRVGVFGEEYAKTRVTNRTPWTTETVRDDGEVTGRD